MTIPAIALLEPHCCLLGNVVTVNNTTRCCRYSFVWLFTSRVLPHKPKQRCTDWLVVIRPSCQKGAICKRFIWSQPAFCNQLCTHLFVHLVKLTISVLATASRGWARGLPRHLHSTGKPPLHECIHRGRFFIFTEFFPFCSLRWFLQLQSPSLSPFWQRSSLDPASLNAICAWHCCWDGWILVECAMRQTFSVVSCLCLVVFTGSFTISTSSVLPLSNDYGCKLEATVPLAWDSWLALLVANKNPTSLNIAGRLVSSLTYFFCFLELLHFRVSYRLLASLGVRK